MTYQRSIEKLSSSNSGLRPALCNSEDALSSGTLCFPCWARYNAAPTILTAISIRRRPESQVLQGDRAAHFRRKERGG